MMYKVLLCLVLAIPAYAQTNGIRKDSTASWRCVRYENDPFQTRYYTLNNGFTVIVSPDESSPRFYSCIAVRAGGKDDPSDNTGLAHYLEHMLFKGTERIGTVDFTKESSLLAEIEQLYEQYNRENNPLHRKKLYQKIDSVSLIASNFAIANEYDKLMQQLGATGTNAFTDYDQTVYINDVPSLQLENWMQIEFERFKSPVLRLFHTELEAVYEEKNISLDSDGFKAYEAMMAGLFKKHTYGTQTVIGKSEHLKNPSLKAIRQYYQKHYVPGNMALIVAGNVNPQKLADLAAATFGTLPAREVKKEEPVQEAEMQRAFQKTVYGQEAPSVLIGFRLPSTYRTGNAEKVYLIKELLGNEQAGLIRKNLVLTQKVLSAGAYLQELSDYSVLMLEGKPLKGQTLEEVKNLLMAQLDSLKKNLPDAELMQAIAANFELSRMEEAEKNESRAFQLLDTYAHNEDPAFAMQKVARMKAVLPVEVNLWMRMHFKENYALIYKEQGKDTNLTKIEKPQISPVQLNSGKQSKFAQAILEREVPVQEPKFVDIQKDIQISILNEGIPLNYVKNNTNRRFELQFVYQNGSLNDPLLPLAFRYLQLAGSQKQGMSYLDETFYKYACTYSISVEENQTKVTLRGAAKHMEQALALLEDLIENPAENKYILENLIAAELQEREDRLSDRSSIRAAMASYALYGRKNPFNQVLSRKQLLRLKTTQLTQKCRELSRYPHQVYYYGPKGKDEIMRIVNQSHAAKSPLVSKSVQKKYIPLVPEKRQVLLYSFPMVQADIGWYGSVRPYNPDSTAIYSLFNEYFGGGMASIVFQTIREARALAYSCYGYYRIPPQREKPVYFHAYIGTQADKADSATEAMDRLLMDMPVLSGQFETAKKSRISQISSDWISQPDLLNFYQRLQNRGLKEDPRKKELEQIQQLQLQDIKAFQMRYLAGENYARYILADQEKLPPSLLQKYKKAKVLQQKELFGY